MGGPGSRIVDATSNFQVPRTGIGDQAWIEINQMPSPESGPVSRSWDDEYRRGRYRGEPSLPLVGQIVDILRDRPETMVGKGLYVGCGNGRNYVALVDAGLDLIGLDVSKEAIAQLQADHPHLTPDLVQADFHDFDSESLLDYIVAIQVFQHGTADTVRSMFARAAKLLKRGGLLFVRVNSASTDVYHSHRVVERGDRGGFTVRYNDGPKRGLAIHFLSLGELRDMMDPWFSALVPTTEQVAMRQSPERGSWAQWEGVWVRR